MPHWGPTSTASGGMEGRESAAQRAAVASCWARGRGGSDGSLSPGGGGRCHLPCLLLPVLDRGHKCLSPRCEAGALGLRVTQSRGQTGLLCDPLQGPVTSAVHGDILTPVGGAGEQG